MRRQEFIDYLCFSYRVRRSGKPLSRKTAVDTASRLKRLENILGLEIAEFIDELQFPSKEQLFAIIDDRIRAGSQNDLKAAQNINQKTLVELKNAAGKYLDFLSWEKSA